MRVPTSLAALLFCVVGVYSLCARHEYGERTVVSAEPLSGAGRLTGVTCGAVALRLVFEAYHIPSSIPDIVKKLRPGSRGASLLSLQRAAQGKGLSATGWMLTFDSLRTVNLPVIIFVNGNHYVVIEKITDDDIVVVRDAWGERRLRKKEFLQCWKGETLIIN